MTGEPAAPPEDRDAAAPFDVGRLGMRLLIAALTVLFAATLMGYLMTRSRAPQWPPPGVPELPAALWISTLILLVSSGTMAWALGAARVGRQAELRLGLGLTFVLGVSFLLSQTVSWFALVAAAFTPTSGLYGFLFYLLTVLHGLHVAGGLAVLGFVTVRAIAGRYSASFHPGVAYTAMYWHFLDAVWIVLFAVLMLTS